METLKNQNPLFQVSEIKVSYHPLFKASERPRVNSSRSAYEILFNNWDLGLLEMQEEFKILLLNRANKVLGIYGVSKGGMAGTIADPKIIFSTALKSSSSSIILSHNHPSGNLNPSQADIDLTKKLQQAGNLLDIAVVDHIILAGDSFYSFADEGLL